MLEQLRKFIEKVRANSEITSFDEIKTKQGIILPILQCLNWNIFDTDEVYPEYPVDKGNVDYALRVSGDNKVFIEAKRVRLQFDTKEKRQILTYADY